jgi:autotransporter-associated beta strand protein
VDDQQNPAHVVPQTGDELQFAGTPPSGGAFNDFPAGMQFQSIDFADSGFTLSGSSIVLTGDTNSEGIDVESGVAGSTILLDVALANHITVDVTDTTLSIAGNISGPNYLTKTGAGTLVLSGVNSYTGGTDIEDGTLQVGNGAASALCGNGLLVNGQNAVLDLNGNNVTVGDVGLINGSITSSTTSAGITATSYMVLNGSIGVALHGTDAPLMKATTDAVTLSGANDYTGPTTVYAGQLNLVGANAWNPVLNLGHTDIQDGKVVFDYSNPDPASTVLSDLTTSYGAGFSSDQNQIYSSTATTAAWLGWMDDTTSQQVTIARAEYGDANLDGYVNLADLGIVNGHWGQNGTWGTGDFNYDGVVNLADLSTVLGNWGQQPTA